MAAQFLYYTQSSITASTSTVLTSLTGTATNLDFLLNYRYQSKMIVATLSGSAYAYEVDLGSGNTLQPQYFIWINHNFYTVGSLDIEVYTKTTDTAIGAYDVSPAVTFTVNLSTYEPIFVAGSSLSSAKRFFKFKLITLPVANSTYCANFFLLASTDVYSPSVDPNLPRDKSFSRNGLVVNYASGGSKFGVSKSGRRRNWSVNYSYISTADKTILENLESAVGGGLRPFVFTDDGGTTYYYVRFDSDLQCNELASGLWDVSFRLLEDI